MVKVQILSYNTFRAMNYCSVWILVQSSNMHRLAHKLMLILSKTSAFLVFEMAVILPYIHIYFLQLSSFSESATSSSLVLHCGVPASLELSKCIQGLHKIDLYMTVIWACRFCRDLPGMWYFKILIYNLWFSHVCYGFVYLSKVHVM